jgi:hypothetical protein
MNTPTRSPGLGRKTVLISRTRSKFEFSIDKCTRTNKDNPGGRQHHSIDRGRQACNPQKHIFVRRVRRSGKGRRANLRQGRCRKWHLFFHRGHQGRNRFFGRRPDHAQAHCCIAISQIIPECKGPSRYLPWGYSVIQLDSRMVTVSYRRKG